MAQGLFITSTGAGCGKTWITRGLARSVRRNSVRIAALKPIETGCAPDPLDALALSFASAEPELVHAKDFYRTASQLSPYGATLEGAPEPADLDRISARVRGIVSGYPVAAIEGVGGLMTPIDRTRSVADFAKVIGFPVLLVARDQPGVVNEVLMAVEVMRARGLRLAAVVLNRHHAGADATRATNRTILTQRLSAPVRVFPPSRDDDDALADSADSADLPSLVR
ncbi:MAG: dethiobiotin synthase [Myxococcales bacterium]|nr:dethiobiotin synthase [Myxococcales bacterium]